MVAEMTPIKFNEKVQMNMSLEVSALEIFQGIPTVQMEILQNYCRTPLSVHDFMERRIGEIGTCEDAKLLRNNYFTTSTTMFRNSSGDVVIASYNTNIVAQHIVNSLNPKSDVKNGRLYSYQLMNADEMYDAIVTGGKHLIIHKGIAQNIAHNAYCEHSTHAACWELMANGDTKLAKSYEELVLTITGNCRANRGLWLPKLEGGYLVWLGSIDHNYSFADGGNNLNSNYGRLVGKVEKTTSASNRRSRMSASLDDSLNIIPDAWLLKKFENQ